MGGLGRFLVVFADQLFTFSIAALAVIAVAPAAFKSLFVL